MGGVCSQARATSRHVANSLGNLGDRESSGDAAGSPESPSSSPSRLICESTGRHDWPDSNEGPPASTPGLAAPTIGRGAGVVSTEEAHVESAKPHGQATRVAGVKLKIPAIWRFRSPRFRLALPLRNPIGWGSARPTLILRDAVRIVHGFFFRATIFLQRSLRPFRTRRAQVVDHRRPLVFSRLPPYKERGSESRRSPGRSRRGVRPVQDDSVSSRG